MDILEIKTKEEFDKIIAENDKVLVDFHAVWCNPCKMAAPELQKAALSAVDVAVVKVDVDVLGQLAEHYEVMGVPTFLCLNKGKEVNRLVGYRSEAELTAALKGI